nr:hypothetical protein [Tanacetum cinerariifolium]
MKTKRKLIPKSYHLTGDGNIVSSDVDHHVYDADLNMSSNKQCLSGSNFISSLTPNVSPSGIQNMTPISGTNVLNTYIDQLIATSHRIDAVFVPLVECQTPLHSVIPTTISRESQGRRRRTKHNCPGGSLSQQPSPSGPPPEYRAGRVALCTYQIYPEYIKLLLGDCHFLENIRIGSHHGIYNCISDTDNKVNNHLSHYEGDNSALLRDIVEGLVDLLDTHSALVTAHEKFKDTHIPNFKVRLYNVVAVKEY